MAKSSRRDARSSRSSRRGNQEVQQEFVRENIYDESPGEYKKPNNHISAKTDNQQDLIDSLYDYPIVAAIGPAGVGKTYVVGSIAAKMLNQGDIERIVLTRANVTVGKTIGLLPGTVEDKMTPLLTPILNVFKERMGSVYGYNMSKRKIEMLPLEYVRGNSYKNTFLIIDEAQNLSVDEVIAIYTRFESGRIVFMGDPFQRDIKGENGLDWLEGFAKRHNLDVPVINFSLDDIVRSKEVKEFLFALYREKGMIPKQVDGKDGRCVLTG